MLAIGFAHCGLLPATTLVRTPNLDSAVIKSERLGGNFAYSTAEGHAYAAISPVVQRVSEPVAVSYTAHQVPLGYAAQPVAVHHHPVVAQQVVAAPSYLAAAPSYLAAAPSYLAAAPGLVAAAPTVVAGAPAAVAAAPAVGAAIDVDTVAVEAL